MMELNNFEMVNCWKSAHFANKPDLQCGLHNFDYNCTIFCSLVAFRQLIAYTIFLHLLKLRWFWKVLDPCLPILMWKKIHFINIIKTNFFFYGLGLTSTSHSTGCDLFLHVLWQESSYCGLLRFHASIRTLFLLDNKIIWTQIIYTFYIWFI